MTAASRPDVAHVSPTFKAAAKGRSSGRRAISPLTLRLTTDERAKLEELADGMTLSAYIRACVFAEETKRRKRRPRTAIADKAAAAEALALLGQSRIASNLNQLAYHANIGAFIEDAASKAQIAEANDHLAAIRALLMTALGSSRAAHSKQVEANNAASRLRRNEFRRARTRSHCDHSEASE